jgi:hypothetical protein
MTRIFSSPFARVIADPAKDGLIASLDQASAAGFDQVGVALDNKAERCEHLRLAEHVRHQEFQIQSLAPSAIAGGLTTVAAAQVACASNDALLQAQQLQNTIAQTTPTAATLQANLLALTTINIVRDAKVSAANQVAAQSAAWFTCGGFGYGAYGGYGYRPYCAPGPMGNGSCPTC